MFPVRKLAKYTAAACFSLSWFAAAQTLTLAQPEEKKPPIPRLVLNTGGPVAPVRAIAFAPKSDRFYSAGDDKVVRVWDITTEGADQTVGATLADHLRWEIARGFRGYVHALAVSPNGDRLAFAGLCARDANGNIMVYDTGLGEVDEVLPTGRGLSSGHRQTVVSLAFSPDGKRLASVSIDGEVRVWSVGEWTSDTLRPAGKFLADPRPAVFLSNRTLAVALPDTDQAGSPWRIALYDVTVPDRQPTRLQQPHHEKVMALARSGDSTEWASADAAGKVYLWKGETSRRAELLRQGRTASCLVFGAGNRLFITTRKDGNNQSVLELWDVSRRERIDQTLLAIGYDSYACAASPDGHYVVAYAPTSAELRLFALKDKNGLLINKPFTSRNLVRLRGSGQRIWKVAFDAGETYRLGLATLPQKPRDRPFGDHGTIDRVFDPGNGRLTTAVKTPAAWRPHDRNSDGWTLTPENEYRLLVFRDGQRLGKIELDPNFQGPARSFCWLVDARGQTYGLAVGTQRQQGVFVYALPNQGECRLLRYYRDHQGWITGLSVSHDGKYLASSSVDQTVKIWSLEGIRAPGRVFVREDAWGAVLKPRLSENDLLVESVQKAGIAVRRGVQAGDVIIAVRLLRNGEEDPLTNATAMKKALEEHPLWDQVLLSVLKGGKGRAEHILLVPAWEPLMTLYVQTDFEWAVWTPQGYYDSSVSGDEMFGFQINRGWNLRPQFFRADRFRRELERPKVLRELLRVGNLPDALKIAHDVLPRDLQAPVIELAGVQPVVSIRQPESNVRLGPGKPIDVEAQVQFQRDEDVQDFEVSCYVNRVPLREPLRRISARTVTYRWQTDPVDAYNHVRVVAEHKEHVAESMFAYADVRVRAAPVAQRKPRIHTLALAANNYHGDDIRLAFAIADAESLTAKFRQSAGEFYSAGMTKILRDEQITRQSVDEAITETRKQLRDVSPQDVLVAFIAGHGIAVGGDYFFVPPHPRITELDFSLIREVGIPWKTVRRLAAVPCRKLFLLDTCYSGNTVLLESDPMYHWKHAIRPIKRTESVVVSATDVGQASFENASLKHGLFTHVLLSGFDGPADGYLKHGFSSSRKDRTVDLSELVHYLVHQVPELADRYGEEQRPKVSPHDVWCVPLTRVAPR